MAYAINTVYSNRTGEYDPSAILSSDNEAAAAVNTLIDGTFDDCGTGCFRELYDSLLKGASWHKADNYFVLHDLNSYVKTLLNANRDYKDRLAFAKKQLHNTANSTYFSSDRTIKEYAQDIWKI